MLDCGGEGKGGWEDGDGVDGGGGCRLCRVAWGRDVLYCWKKCGARGGP